MFSKLIANGDHGQRGLVPKHAEGEVKPKIGRKSSLNQMEERVLDHQF